MTKTSNTTGPAVSRIIPNNAPSVDKTPDASTISDLPLGRQDWLESTTETSASPTDTGLTLPLGGQESNEFSPSLQPPTKKNGMVTALKSKAQLLVHNHTILFCRWL